jgi:hypothetical protein
VEITPEPVTVVLQPAAWISGRVVDVKGDSPEGGRVLVSGGPGGSRSRNVVNLLDGEFRTDNLAAGTYSLLAEVPGYLPSEPQVVELAAGQEVEGLKITLRPGATLEGQVLSSEGVPVHHARLVVVSDPESRSSRHPSRARTDGDGHYRLEGIAPGSRQVEINHPGHPRTVRTVEIQPGSQEQNFTLEAGLTVTGRAVSTTGEAVTGVEVRLTHSDNRESVVQFTQADGLFQFANLAAARYRLWARSPDWIVVDEAKEVEVRAGMPDLEILLTRGAFLVGRVQASDPQARIRIIASREQQRGPHAELEASGPYRLGPLAPGEWTVRASALETGEQVERTVTVESGDGEIPLDLELETGLVLSGRILRDGEPLASAYLQATALAPEGQDAFDTTSFQGTFRLKGLTAGEYRLWIGARGSGIRHIETVTVTGDQDLLVEISTFPVAGVVRSGLDGSPVVNAAVTFHPLAETPVIMESRVATYTRTGPDGTFRFPTLTRGRWKLGIQAAGHSAYEESFDLPRDFGSGLEITLKPDTGSP